MNITEKQQFISWLNVDLKTNAKTYYEKHVVAKLSAIMFRNILVSGILCGFYVSDGLINNRRYTLLLCMPVAIVLTYVVLRGYLNIRIPILQNDFEKLVDENYSSQVIKKYDEFFKIHEKSLGRFFNKGTILSAFYESYKELTNNSLFLEICLKNNTLDILKYATDEAKIGCKKELILYSIQKKPELYNTLPDSLKNELQP